MAAYQYIYVMKGLSKTYPGGREVLQDIWLSFLPGAKIGVLGLNGAGKSTLLRIMAGDEHDFSARPGPPRGRGSAFCRRSRRSTPTRTSLGNVMEGLAETKALLDRFEAVSARFAEDSRAEEMDALIAEQGDLQEKIDQADAWDLDRTVEIAMDALRCPPGDADGRHPVGRRAAPGGAVPPVVAAPDLLLLDEPTNHLDAEFGGLAAALSEGLSRHRRDRHARPLFPRRGRRLDPRTRPRPRHPVRGQLHGLARTEAGAAGAGRPPGGGAPAHPGARARMGAAEPARPPGEEQGAASPPTRRWWRRAARRRPRRRRSSCRRGRGSATWWSRREHVKQGFRRPAADRGSRFPPAARRHRRGDRAERRRQDDAVPHDHRPGEPDDGGFRIGETVKLGYVDQSRDTLAPNKTVWQEISGGQDEIDLGRRKIASRAYCALFNFRGPDQQKKVGQLSGGERNRVHLAKMLKKGANLLLLDEPTNDLDVDTLRALEEALLEYPGCAVIITHDRWFLDRIATHILAFEGDSQVEWFEGNYADYEADRKRRLGAEADQPHRIKYKPLVRA